MNKIYMIFIYPDYPVDPVKKMEIPILSSWSIMSPTFLIFAAVLLMNIIFMIIYSQKNIGGPYAFNQTDIRFKK